MGLSAKSEGNVKSSDHEEAIQSARTVEVKHVETDSESEDEAPEEEGVSTAKDAMEQELKRREQAVKLEEQILKEKRRRQDAMFKEQQLAKKAKVTSPTQVEELSPEFLDRLEDEAPPITTIPKHINFNDIDQDSKLYSEEVKQQIKKKKKTTLKKLRATMKKKGPVSISLLPSESTQAVMAPAREASVMKTKDKWLKRKSLNKIK